MSHCKLKTKCELSGSSQEIKYLSTALSLHENENDTLSTRSVLITEEQVVINSPLLIWHRWFVPSPFICRSGRQIANISGSRWRCERLLSWQSDCGGATHLLARQLTRSSDCHTHGLFEGYMDSQWPAGAPQTVPGMTYRVRINERFSDWFARSAGE